ncbi:Keratin, type I cytoskeletal 18 [Tupaia chinensis]|uniref:Keratin, type I cytoskeletal 18 n=1 Tax=Tupaia chinensis TaxID=246437 RepID=L9L2K2_TUPCH|nr:Keratin, type I cytoskeletal 18 [Tupaia chinensis]
MVRALVGIGSIQGKKETMQDLNNCLASNLDKVRNLEIDNWMLESKIREHLERKRPQVRDWGHHFKTMEELRTQIFANTVDNVTIILQIDNAQLAADDFRVKYETELRQIEALKEELLFMKKNHEEKVNGLQAQIASSGLTVEVDAPKSQDLSKIMADIQVQYDKLAQKN